MTDIVLTIEQMRHLKELGLDTSDATLFWEYYPDDCGYDDYDGHHISDIQDDACIVNIKSNKSASYYPAYTLQDILEKLPRYIYEWDNYDRHCYHLAFDVYIQTCFDIRYFCDDDGGDLKFIHSASLLKCAYKMLCWCIENNYI